MGQNGRPYPLDPEEPRDADGRPGHRREVDEYLSRIPTGEMTLSGALGKAVDHLFDRGGASGRAAAIWSKAVGPIGMRHTRGIFVKESADPDGPPTLYVYLDSNAFVYEYATDHILYEQRLANLGFHVRKVEFRLSRNAGTPAPAKPLEAPTALPAGEPKAPPLDRLPPLDSFREEWAWRTVEAQSLPLDLARAIYEAMVATMRRNQSEGR